MKLKSVFWVILHTALLASLCAGQSATPEPAAWWKFDAIQSRRVLDYVSQQSDSVYGFQKLKTGVSGQALLFDGYTSYVERAADSAPEVSGDFTIEAWIAFQAYPWNWVAVVDQLSEKHCGYYLGVDANGHLRLSVGIGSETVEITSSNKMDLLKWYHIAGTYNEKDGMSIFINGREAGKLQPPGEYSSCSGTSLLIGRSHKKLPPAYPIRLDLPASYSFDGIIDEVKIFNRSLSREEIVAEYEALKPTDEWALSFRKLPAGPAGPGRFGAYYTKLKFSETWDAPWRVGPYADVVVRFDQASYKFVFWRGTSYIPFWVTENGIWYTNEFNETWGKDVLGCAEPMSDKQARQSHVRIIENNDARVVVHWRYALVDNRGVIAKTDPVSGWGDWSDEYYTIYPDGISLRKIHLWSSQPTKPHQFQEAIILNPPGTRPEDNIETEAVTMVNMAGQNHTYSWAEGPPEALDKPAKANIQIINLKAKSRPYIIVNEGKPSVTRRNVDTDGPWLKPYRGEINRQYSIFPWWNHWPVAQIPSDGRWATEPDRVSHSSLSNDLEWKELELTDRTHVRVMMHGLSDKDPQEIVTIAKSWLYPAEMQIRTKGFSGGNYAQEERAYLVRREPGTSENRFKFSLLAEKDHPLVNPAFIITEWGDKPIELKINGREIKRGKDFRYGYRHRLEGSDLILWLSYRSESRVDMELLSVQ